MQDRPSREELLRGIARFLEAQVIPALSEPLRYHTRVAANLLKIIERELDQEPAHLNQEIQGLRRLLGLSVADTIQGADLKKEVRTLNEILVQRIRQGEADHPAWGKAVFDHLKETAIRKLEIANPRMIEAARTR